MRVLNSFGGGSPRSPLTGHLTGRPAVNCSQANNVMQTYLVTSVSVLFAATIPVPPARIGGAMPSRYDSRTRRLHAWILEVSWRKMTPPACHLYATAQSCLSGEQD
jgi:hypothetical protein